MPFEPASPLGGFTGLPDEPQLERPEAPSAGEAFGSAFRLDNTVGSAVVSETVRARRNQAGLIGPVPVDPNYDPWADIAGTHYEPYYEKFAHAENKQIGDAIKTDIDRENKDRDTIAKSGLTGVGASMAAGLLDWPILLPVGEIASTAKGGVNLLKTFARTATAGAVAVGGQEAALHASQQTRTLEESAYAIGGGAILAGLLGTGFAKIFTPAEHAHFGGRIEEDFKIPPIGEHDPFVPGSFAREARPVPEPGATLPGLPRAGSAGAAAVERPEDILKSALGSERAFKFQDPGLRTLGSSSALTRRYAQELFEQPFAFTKSAAGEETAPIGSSLGAPGAVETRIKMWHAPLSDALQTVDDAFLRYRKGRSARFPGELSATTLKDTIFGTERLSYRQFKEEISKALRNDDTHEIPEVAEAAKAVRAKVLDPLKNEAIAADLLPEDIGVKTAPSYLNRLYNREKIIAERDQFKRVVADWLHGTERTNAAVRTRLQPLIGEKRELEAAIRKAENQIARRAATADKVEAAQAEAARMNFFAYKRSVKLSEPVDELRTALDDFSGRIRTGIDDVLDSANRLRASNPQSAAVVEQEAGRVSEALADINYQADLVDAVTAGDTIDNAIASVSQNFRDLLGNHYLSTKAAQASPEWKAVRALEAERDALGRRLRPYRKELERVRKEEATRAEKAPTQKYSGPPLAQDEIDTVVNFWNYVRELYARPTPQRLSSFVVSQGGVLDPHGDVLSMIGGHRGRPGLVRKGPIDMGPGFGFEADSLGHANSLDSMALRAWENGFFPELTQRPTINEFLDKLGEDLQHGNVVRGEDERYFEDFATAQQMEHDLEDYGVTPRQFRSEAKLRAFLGEKSAAGGAGEDAVAPRSPGQRADEKAIQAELDRRLPRAREGAVFETEIRGRSNTLADQASGKRAAIDTIQTALEQRRARLAAVNDAIEQEIATYEGKSAKRAKAAVEQRNAAEAERTPEQRAAKPRLTSADKEVMRTARRIASQLDKEPGEIQDLADQIIDRILGTPDGRLPYDAHMDTQTVGGVSQQVRGPLAARTFMIPDKLIEPWLENDVEELLRAYTHTMAPDIELTKRFGSMDMVQQMKEITEDYAQRSTAATTAKERQKIHRQRNSDIRDLAAIRDRLRGVYALPANPDSLLTRSARVIGAWNFLRLLGGMTLSALPDIGRPVMAHGVLRTVGDGLVPMLRSWSTARLAMGEVKLSGTALDMVLDSRAMRIADVREDFGRHTKFERGIKSMTRNYGIVSLMAPWNATLKQFTGLITMTRMLQACDAVAAGTIKPKELEYLAAGGISRENALKIADQFKQHGRKQGGIWLANTAQWDQRQTVDAFRALLVRDVDRTIVTPGAADRPLWMSSELGRLVGQFKSFSLSSMQKVLISGLQQRDAAILNGVILSIALGGLTHVVKVAGGGHDTGLPKGGEWGINQKTAQFLVNSVDRSGLTGWLMDANNMSEKFTHGAIGLSAITGKPVSRYASRNITASLLGPSVGTVEDAIRIMGATVDRNWSQGDSAVLKRLIPYSNLFYLRQIFDKAQEGIDDYFKVPAKKVQQ